jgi:hypothetical protein
MDQADSWYGSGRTWCNVLTDVSFRARPSSRAFLQPGGDGERGVPIPTPARFYHPNLSYPLDLTHVSRATRGLLQSFQRRLRPFPLKLLPTSWPKIRRSTWPAIAGRVRAIGAADAHVCCTWSPRRYELGYGGSQEPMDGSLHSPKAVV